MIQLILTLKKTTAQVVDRLVLVHKSPIQDYVHPNDHAGPTYFCVCWTFQYIWETTGDEKRKLTKTILARSH